MNLSGAPKWQQSGFAAVFILGLWLRTIKY